jgi:hypothetical protein
MPAASRKRMPLVRFQCHLCGGVMVVYTTRRAGDGTVRYWRCSRTRCKGRRKISVSE